jgi:hypothetical protein
MNDYLFAGHFKGVTSIGAALKSHDYIGSAG